LINHRRNECPGRYVEEVESAYRVFAPDVIAFIWRNKLPAIAGDPCSGELHSNYIAFVPRRMEILSLERIPYRFHSAAQERAAFETYGVGKHLSARGILRIVHRVVNKRRGDCAGNDSAQL